MKIPRKKRKYLQSFQYEQFWDEGRELADDEYQQGRTDVINEFVSKFEECLNSIDSGSVRIICRNEVVKVLNMMFEVNDDFWNQELPKGYYNWNR